MLHILVDKNINYISINIQECGICEVFIRIKHLTHYFDDECFPVILDFLDDRVTHHVKDMLFEEGNKKSLNYLKSLVL